MILDDETFYLFAIRHYDNINCQGLEEFNDDVKKFQYIKRLLKKYVETDKLKTRLILNHIVILYNCFGPSATDMLFMKLEGFHKQLKPFVEFINYMPRTVSYKNEIIQTKYIINDEKVVKELKQI